MPQGLEQDGKKPRRRSRGERFLETLAGAPEAIVLTHSTPDPDAIASGWGLCVLIEEKLSVPVQLVAGGLISRAENRALVRLLKPPLELVGDDWAPSEAAALVVVDTAFLPRLPGLPTGQVAAVIDHHAPVKGQAALAASFRDLRPRLVATSSIVTTYLRELKVQPAAPLATALTYGIYSDAGVHEKFTPTDSAALSWLARRMDPALFGQIGNPPLESAYYEDLALALESCFTYDGVALCFLPRASCPEVVGEVADLLIRGEGIESVLCAAVVESRMICSARTSTQGGSAADLVGKTLKDESGASWGGHEHRAGGHVNLNACPLSPSDLEGRIRQNWLAATGVEKQRGLRLVAKKEILRALQ